MSVSLAEQMYIITEMRVKNLLSDALSEYSSVVLNKYDVTIQKIPLTRKEVDKFGDYLFGYEDGNWATGGKHRRIRDITDDYVLEAMNNLNIILVKDDNKMIVVDGFHRTAALWQSKSKLKDIQGTIYVLSSPYIRSIFPWDLVGH